MKKLFIVLVLALFLGTSYSLYAQYTTAVGARLGFFNGFNVKHFLNDRNAVEGILSFRWNGFVITGLYVWQKPFPDVPNLYWFIGGGAHVGFWGESNNHWDTHQAYTIIGADFIIGLEYNFPDIPLSLALDYKPAFNFVGYNNWWFDGGALSVRYTFK